MIMKILLHIQNSPSKARCRQTSVGCSKFICGGGGGGGGFEGRCHPGYVYSHLSLETVFPAFSSFS